MECPTVRIKSTDPKTQGDFVDINAEDYDATKHVLFDLPPPPPMPAPPPAPVTPPPPVDPLADLPKNWREKEGVELRALAETVTGRTAENKAQAIEMIEQAVLSRK